MVRALIMLIANFRDVYVEYSGFLNIRKTVRANLHAYLLRIISRKFCVRTISVHIRTRL